MQYEQNHAEVCRHADAEAPADAGHGEAPARVDSLSQATAICRQPGRGHPRQAWVACCPSPSSQQLPGLLALPAPPVSQGLPGSQALPGSQGLFGNQGLPGPQNAVAKHVVAMQKVLAQKKLTKDDEDSGDEASAELPLAKDTPPQ